MPRLEPLLLPQLLAGQQMEMGLWESEPLLRLQMAMPGRAAAPQLARCPAQRSGRWHLCLTAQPLLMAGCCAPVASARRLPSRSAAEEEGCTRKVQGVVKMRKLCSLEVATCQQEPAARAGQQAASSSRAKLGCSIRSRAYSVVADSLLA